MRLSRGGDTTNMSRTLLKTAALTGAAVAGTQVAVVGGLVLLDRLKQLEREKRTAPKPGTFREQVGESDLTVYTAADRLYDDMVGAIETAEHTVMFKTYIWKDDEAGWRFMRALNAAADRGVNVYVIYDVFANTVVSRSFFDQFSPNVKLHRMYPMGSEFWRAPIRNIGFNHSKILLTDDQVGFVGGFNIGDRYLDAWRDTHLRQIGPGVWGLRQAFVNVWNERAEGDLGWIPPKSWDPTVRVSANLPVQLVYPIRHVYISALQRARDHVFLTTPYFVPDRQVLSVLVEAAGRGVDVRVMLPKASNHIAADWVTRSFYADLLEAGVTVLLYTPATIHAKTATVDGIWSTIGTANIDRLSLGMNYEANVEVIDAGFAQRMEEIFDADARHCEVLQLAQWRQRPVVAKAAEKALIPLRVVT